VSELRPPTDQTDARLAWADFAIIAAGLLLVWARTSNQETRELVRRQRRRIEKLEDGGVGGLDGALERLHEALGEIEALRGELATRDQAIESLSRQLMAARTRQ
jgi:hypothetical protein